jgi:hypothetical protein
MDGTNKGRNVNATYRSFISSKKWENAGKRTGKRSAKLMKMAGKARFSRPCQESALPLS